MGTCIGIIVMVCWEKAALYAHRISVPSWLRYVGLDRSTGSGYFPATAQRLVQSDQVCGHRDLTLREQIFAVVKLPLSVEDRQKVHETRPIALSRQLNRRLASGDGVPEMVAPLLLEGVVDQGMLGLLKRDQYRGAITELGLRQARVLQGDVRTNPAASKYRHSDGWAHEEEIAQRKAQVVQLRRLSSRSSQQREAREIFRLCPFDPGRGGCNLYLGAANIRSPLQQIRGKTDRNLWRDRWHRSGRLEFCPQRARLCAEKNTESIDRGCDRSLERWHDRTGGLLLCDRTLHVQICCQSRLGSRLRQGHGVLLALDVPFGNLQAKLEAAKIGIRSGQITKQYYQHIATILFGRTEVVGRGLYFIADPAEHIEFPGAVKP